MNCTNCGAPMRLVSNRDYFACDYCASFHFPETSSENDDGVQTLGEASDRHCPICDIELQAATVEETRVLHCIECRGVLTANDDFRHIVNRRRAAFDQTPVAPQPIDESEMKRAVDCPFCDRPMDVHPYYGPGNVVVDTCRFCRAIWVDHGEITAIQVAPGKR